MIKREQSLAKVRVLELSTDVGAAYCGQLLASLGADVVRLVEAGHAYAIHTESLGVTPELSAAEISLERSKTRLVLDGNLAAKRERIAKCLLTADVVVTDYSVDELRALGLHWDDVRARHPRLIFARVTVFGSTGPKAEWQGGDLEAQAFAGVAGQLGAADKAPICMPYKAVLMHGGLHAAAAIAGALFHRSLSGEGTFIDISTAQAMAADVRNYSLMMRYYDLPLKRSGRRPQGSLGRYPTAIFPCKDGYVVMTARSGEQYHNMLAMMGNPAWAQNPRYQNAYGMAMEYPDEVDALVIPWLMQYTRSELVEMGMQHRFPIGPLLTLDEVVKDEQFLARDFFEDIEVDGKSYLLPGSPSVVVRAAG